MPAWFKKERNTASLANLSLLQRYLILYHVGAYPEALSRDAFPPGTFWPRNPWTGGDMAAGDGLGEYSYTRTASGFALKVKLTTGWSSPALGPIL